MEFDHFCFGLLTKKTIQPDRSDSENDAIQDAHMSHLADLHDQGLLLVAGPLSHDEFRGILIFTSDLDTATRAMLADPAVKADWFDVAVIPWMVPSGAMTFSPVPFPRSMSDIVS
jgi:hypothetical protein